MHTTLGKRNPWYEFCTSYLIGEVYYLSRYVSIERIWREVRRWSSVVVPPKLWCGDFVGGGLQHMLGMIEKERKRILNL